MRRGGQEAEASAGAGAGETDLHAVFILAADESLEVVHATRNVLGARALRRLAYPPLTQPCERMCFSAGEEPRRSTRSAFCELRGIVQARLSSRTCSS